MLHSQVLIQLIVNIVCSRGNVVINTASEEYWTQELVKTQEHGRRVD